MNQKIDSNDISPTFVVQCLGPPCTYILSRFETLLIMWLNANSRLSCTLYIASCMCYVAEAAYFRRCTK